MSIAINYKKSPSKKHLGNLILFVDENFNITTLKKLISSSEYSFINDLLKTKDNKKKILTFDISSKRKIILVSTKKNPSTSAVENLGAKFYDIFKNSKLVEYSVNSDTSPKGYNNFVGYFLHGLRLKSYKFEKYKTKK